MQMSGYLFLFLFINFLFIFIKIFIKKCERIKGWRKPNRDMTKTLFSQTIPGKIFGTRYINPVK